VSKATREKELEWKVRRLAGLVERLSITSLTIIACEMLDGGGGEGARELQNTINYYRDEATSLLGDMDRE
jgi:hypothetical protein